MYTTRNHKEGVEKLLAMDIRTTRDLDEYKAKHDPHNSRYNVLKAIVGDDATMWILNDLALNQCAF